MMRKWFLGVAAAFVLAPAAPAAADYYCAPSATGGFTACASVSVSFDAVNQLIHVDITNEDLWAIAQGYNVQTEGYMITGFGIEGPPTTGALSLASVTPMGGATGNAQFSDWTITTNLSGFSVYTGASANGINGGILGCRGEFPTYFRTCVDGATTGFVRFTFSTEMDNWDASAALIALRMQSEGDISYRCTDDPTATNGEPCGTSSTVPEPITMVLFGSGLVAVGAARRRRRREDEV